MEEFLKIISNDMNIVYSLCAVAIVLAAIIAIMIFVLFKKNKSLKQISKKTLCEKELSKELFLEQDEKIIFDEKISESKDEVQKHNLEKNSYCEYCLELENNIEEDAKCAQCSADIVDEIDQFEENKKKIYVRHRNSFTARLIQSSDIVKARYVLLHNNLLSYKRVKSRVSWNFDSINSGRKKLAKLNAHKKSLYFYCALLPSELEETKFKVKYVGDKKKYFATPSLYIIKSERGLKNALKLVDLIMKKNDLLFNQKPQNQIKIENYPYESKDNLIKRGLIKVNRNKI